MYVSRTHDVLYKVTGKKKRAGIFKHDSDSGAPDETVIMYIAPSPVKMTNRLIASQSGAYLAEGERLVFDSRTFAKLNERFVGN